MVTGAAGEFGAAQVARLTAANVGFPRPDLHIHAGVLQPDDALVAAGARDRSMIHLQVDLCIYNTQLSWRTIEKRTDGVRTLIVSALDGSVLGDKFDPSHDGREGR